jgi:hypothetical protein
VRRCPRHRSRDASGQTEVPAAQTGKKAIIVTTAVSPEEQADFARRFEGFDPAAAEVYEAGEALPPDLRLVQAAAARQLYARRGEAVMRDAVGSARSAGLSWHKIGLVLGTTGEAVRKRYA